MSGTDAVWHPVGHGIADLAVSLDLQPTASGVWTDTDLTVTLPSAGTYQLDATVRAAMIVISPTTCYIEARLWDETAALIVPRSEVFVQQSSMTVSAGTVTDGVHGSAPIQTEYTVTGPSTVRLQAARFFTPGNSETAWIYGGSEGRTTLRYLRIA